MSAARRPNIISITSHDLGRHLGCYGPPTLRTPNLDRMAAEGVRFTNSFCSSPGCSPSRASLYTGRYPHNNGVMGLTHAHFAWDLYPGEKHLVHYLNDAGYESAQIGGQHETRHPDKLGFTHGAEDSWIPCHQASQRAIDWMRVRTDSNTPFYLQLGYFEPHRPFDFGEAPPDTENGVHVPPFLVDTPEARQEFAAYQGAIHQLDAAIGRLLEWVDSSPLADNTLIIFTTDHGMPFPRAKCSLYDPGIEVAHIVKWRGQPWSDGRVLDPMISNIDQLPTLLELLGIPIPDNVQGRSWLPLLEGGDYQPNEAIFAEKTYHDYCDPMRCIRTQTHKLIVNFTAAPGFMDPSQTYHSACITKVPADPAHDYHEPVELYDLTADPLEQNNLAEDHDHKDICHALLARLHKWMIETEDPLPDGIPCPPMHTTALEALKNSIRQKQ